MEGRRSRRFPNRRPTVAPVVGDRMPSLVHKKMDLLPDESWDKNQEMVSDKKSVNNQEMVSDVKIGITPEISNTFHKEKQAFENKTLESADHITKNTKPAVLVIKKNNTKEEVVMKKHVAAEQTGSRTPKMVLGMRRNFPKTDLGAEQAKVVQITSALKKEVVRRPKTRSILIKKVLTNSQIPEKAELGPKKLVEKLPQPMKLVERKPPPPKANLMKRRPKLFEERENVSTKPREIDPTTRPTANNKRAGFGQRQPLKLVEQPPELMRTTSRSRVANSTRRPKLFERPEHVVSTKSKEHNLNARPSKNTKLDQSLDLREAMLGKEEIRRAKMLKTTTESPEAWLDRFADERHIIRLMADIFRE